MGIYVDDCVSSLSPFSWVGGLKTQRSAALARNSKVRSCEILPRISHSRMSDRKGFPCEMDPYCHSSEGLSHLSMLILRLHLELTSSSLAVRAPRNDGRDLSGLIVGGGRSEDVCVNGHTIAQFDAHILFEDGLYTKRPSSRRFGMALWKCLRRWVETVVQIAGMISRSHELPKNDIGKQLLESCHGCSEYRRELRTNGQGCGYKSRWTTVCLNGEMHDVVPKTTAAIPAVAVHGRWWCIRTTVNPNVSQVEALGWLQADLIAPKRGA